MKLPFTTEEFLGVFRDYNLAVWPVQVIFYLFAVTVVILAFRRNKKCSFWTSVFLGFLWIWMGIAYHFLFFTEINNAAYAFAIIFVLEGVFIFRAAMKKKAEYFFQYTLYGFTGLVFLLFALVIYPLAGYFAGHIYPTSPTFGLPCPTTIFTFGFFLLSLKSLPGHLLIIPFIWSLIGTTAAFGLGIVEDIALGVSGVVTLFLYFMHGKKKARN